MKNSYKGPKVIFLTTGYPTEYRPQECIFIHRSIKVLSARIQPAVIHFRALKPGRKLVEKRAWDGIEVLTVSCPQLPYGSYSHFNSRLIESLVEPLVMKVLNSADLIHGAEAYPAGYVAGMWAINHHKPVTFNVNGSDLNLFLKRNYSKVGKQWLLNLRGIVCNSDKIKKNLLQLFGELPNIRTIYRGVDTDTFTPEGSKAGPQASLAPVRFLYLGGFHTWDPDKPEYNLKGGQTLLEAWKSVDRLKKSASLIIGGPGNYQDQIENWRKFLQTPQSVFCIHSINPSEVAGYIRASDVVIIPSLQEGLPNLANEAQACARPVLGTFAGGISESVQNGETGILVEPGNAHALAKSMIWFCDHQAAINDMGKKGVDRMNQYFTWEQYRNNMVDFIKSAI